MSKVAVRLLSFTADKAAHQYLSSLARELWVYWHGKLKASVWHGKLKVIRHGKLKVIPQGKL